MTKRHSSDFSHSPLLAQLKRTLRSAEGDQELPAKPAATVSRRKFLSRAGQAAILGAVGAAMPTLDRLVGAKGASADVGIVGAGLAGLVCADQLQQRGIQPAVYEASSRVGGRQWSRPSFYAGQTIERGGELIDNLHKTMLGYARRFNLRLENYHRNPGEVFYYFGGARYPESDVVREYRAFVPRMREDLRKLSAQPTASNHTAADEVLDNLSLRAYLESRAAGPLIKAVIEEAYVAEYGLEPWEQSCLGFLLFIHADRRSKFTPFGIFSDERYHVIGGNDGIAQGIAAALARPVDFGMTLVRVAKTLAGRIQLTFDTGGGTVTRTHDHVVLTLPFSVLRGIDLDASLQLPPAKVAAIQNLGYGNNAKMMVAFTSRPWSTLGSNGSSYSDLSNHQATWETNWSQASPSHGVMTDYSGGQRGASLNPAQVQVEAQAWLADADLVYPGLATAAARDAGNNIVAHLEHWPSNPLTRGSYTCYRPGQFTTIAGNEGTPVGNLHFAGEHTNSFYEWQGFMEGACLSGIQAASEILAVA